MNRSKIRILVADEDPDWRARVQEALQREGYEVDPVADTAQALTRLHDRRYDLIVGEVRPPQGTGFPLLAETRQHSRDTPVILLAAEATVDHAVEAMRQGAFEYLAKPLDLDRLRRLVSQALEPQTAEAHHREFAQRPRKPSEPSLLIGESEAIRRVVRMAEEVGRSDVTVFIEGESGTGKELVARLVHAHSARADKPFIFVNCAALPETLIEAELFGHTKGSFTGAVADKAGRFQLADGGTLFLDEIGDLGAKGQGDLLRVLEDGAFRSVGGTALQRVDVRLITATNKNLPAAVAEGKFREDLYYRLQIVPIAIPPLRERAEDIPLLIESFISQFAHKHKRRRKQLSREALQLCQRFPWPGNVRQLRNVIERLVVTCPNPTIEVADLPDFLQLHDRTAQTFPMRVGMTLAEAEKLLIRQTLTQVTSNRQAAADALGISRRTLQYKLKQYGLLDL